MFQILCYVETYLSSGFPDKIVQMDSKEGFISKVVCSYKVFVY